MRGIKANITHPKMNVNEHTSLRQRLNAVQRELIEGLGAEMGTPMTPALERVVHTLDWVRIEDFVADGCGVGRPPRERFALANAFIAKAVLRLPTTVALIKEPLGDQLIGHISRDGTAIEVRERPANQACDVPPAADTAQAPLSQDAAPAQADTPTPERLPKKRGRPRRGEVREPKAPSHIGRQRRQDVQQMLDELPKHCDRGAKCNAQGYKIAWNGYKLHFDTADCGVPISAVLTSASVHDSQVAVPLSRLSAQRVTNLYDVMDAAYCSAELREDSRSLGHVPLIDHNPRSGVKLEFDPPQAQRDKERTVAERMNARLKDEFGGNNVWVRGPVKVMSHLMFGVLVLSADQLMRLLQ